MIAVEVVYLSSSPHGDFLAAKGVVLGDWLDGDRASLFPLGGGVANQVDGFGAEVIWLHHLAQIAGLGLGGVQSARLVYPTKIPSNQASCSVRWLGCSDPDGEHEKEPLHTRSSFPEDKIVWIEERDPTYQLT